MVFRKIVTLLCFILFICHSVINVYNNLVNVKTTQNIREIPLSSIDFPLTISVTVEPGYLKKISSQMFKRILRIQYDKAE